MIARAPALVALMAGARHVQRHYPALPVGTVGPHRRGELMVALNVLRELDLLLRHAIAEAAPTLGVVMVLRDDGRPSTVAALQVVCGASGSRDRVLDRANAMLRHLSALTAGRRSKAPVPAPSGAEIAQTYHEAAEEIRRRVLPPVTPKRGILMRPSEQFTQRAAECRQQAATASLTNVRERCLRAEQAWTAMAVRAARAERGRDPATPAA